MSRHWRIVNTAQGWCGVARSEAGLVKCTLPRSDRDSAMLEVSSEAAEATSDDLLSEATRLLEAYFTGRRTIFDLPLAPEGVTEFVQRVLEACARIDYGDTLSYAEVAAAAGAPRAARAVGQALASNPLPIIVPCHRVIGADGNAVGFSAGIGWKLRLLAMEGVELHRFEKDRRRHDGGAGAGAHFG